MVLAPDADTYSFKLEDALPAIRHRLSNYNIHYFESIDELRRFVEPKFPAAIGLSRPRESRWQLVHPDTMVAQTTVAENEAIFKLYPANPSRYLFRAKRNGTALSTQHNTWFPEEMTVAQLDDRNRAALITNLARTTWFNMNLRETPPMPWMSQERVAFDETAVAPALIPTGYIDLSESFDVAAFFATCQYNSTKSSWEPVTEGEGVIYVVDRLLWTRTRAQSRFFPTVSKTQRTGGWVYEMTLGETSMRSPHVRKMIFKQDRRLSKTSPLVSDTDASCSLSTRSPTWPGR